jgi:hypothetical protein
MVLTARSVNAAVNAALQNRWDFRCLDEDVSSPTHNGTKVQTWGCNGSNQQGWDWVPQDSWNPLNSWGTIHSRYDGRCLDVDTSGGINNGTKVQVWDCNGWANQDWRFEFDSSNGFKIVGVQDKCLDVNWSRIGDGNELQVWDCGSADNQVWQR